ncbi:hypothetical protein E4U59_006688 [Claviceps monticola]|nr:hypothetical protein E4U59_006688 [Claviceps monticola]
MFALGEDSLQNPRSSAPRSEGSSRGSRKNCIRDEADTASRESRRVYSQRRSIGNENRKTQRKSASCLLSEAALSEHIAWM